MRFDLYTFEDRAREAYAYYRKRELDSYMSWVSGGALIVAWLFVIGMAYYFPEYIYQGDVPSDRTHWITIIFSPMSALRSWVIGLIVFAVTWILGKISAIVVAVYQGVIFGIIAGIVVYLLFLAIFTALGITTSKLIPFIIGSIAALLVLVAGVFGMFLPDA